MRFKITTLAMILLGISATGHAQEVSGWTLKQCIDYARENNIQVQQARITKQNSDQDVLQSKEQAFPTLSASSNQNFSISRAADLEGNFKDVKSTYSGSYGLSSSITIYNGSRITNNRKIQKLNNDAYALDILDAQNDIEVAVTQAYLSILYAKESVTTSENTLLSSNAQASRAEEMYKQGSISLADYSQIKSQNQSDNYNLVNARNNLASAILKLKQLLELGIDEEFTVAFPVLDDDNVLKIIPSVSDVYYTALDVMPDMKSSRLAVEASQMNVKVARASGMPSITANASVGTNGVSGMGVEYMTQLGRNVNGGAGVSINIPIFNGRSARTSVAKAKNSVAQTELSYQNAQKNLLSTIESLHQDASGAQSRYVAAKAKLESAELSYNLVCEKYNEGMINAVELLTEKNVYTAAQQELNQAKYQAILSLALLNFYMDKPIEL